MINRIIASLIYRLGLPFQYVAEDSLNGSDRSALAKLEKELAAVPRYTPGVVSVAGWNLFYIDAPALISCFDTIIVKRWNDFIARREDPLILDCGANIGVSVLHYKRLYPKSQIVAFEPDKEICEVLGKNLVANGIGGVEVVEAAVWTAEGQHTFLSEGADGSRLVAQPVGSDRGGEYTVRTVRLADYLDASRVDFIKLDIEGAEWQVLADCADRLRNVESMVIEFHLMNNNPPMLALAFKALSDAGFSLSINSYGPWVDLTHPPTSKPTGDLSFDQYMLVCAWRP
ncbi:MAG: hypothetical protein QOF61_2820 [Acidobacteriota bacterium]|jgi:FkbM family methyltransferase|nr:hypothetical protein [Acidobacteriota bacterium]